MEPLSRPVGPDALGDRARAWLEWFGLGRLVASAAAVVAVSLGVFWLVRSPVPPTEASLPMATTSVPDPSAGSAAAAASAAPVTAEASGVVLVHVAGAVVEPGVYQLLPDARVRDALVAAGGPTAHADWDAVNLAAFVADGTRVYIPTVGEAVPVEAVTGGAGGAMTPAGPVDVNRATPEQLESLPGVGPATALAIVTERDRNGPFVDVDDLDRVPGIGPAKLEALRDLVRT